ncbi:MAG: hypothetical protein AAGL89_16025 [Pseudomonadota bacterium]
MTFTYETTFSTCIAEPSAPRLAETCAVTIEQSYVLRRAVLTATQACLGQDLATCALPFEDQGLPAAAAAIAAGTGCQNSDLSRADAPAHLPATHCAALIADILSDEGVVPLNTDIACSETDFECNDLAAVHSDLWIDVLDQIGRGDPIIEDLHDRNISDCIDDAASEDPPTANRLAAQCLAARTAMLWADLVNTQ